MRLPVMAATAPPSRQLPTPPFHVLAKPIGPICNLDCKYCFYLEKEKLYPEERRWRMPDDVLETFIRQYIAAQPGQEVNFAWQGGEPTLLGLDFFRNVLSLQARHAAASESTTRCKPTARCSTTHGVQFLTEQQFVVGLSIDGPRGLHDRYRVDKQQTGTYDAVMRGLKFLRKHGTDFHTLTVVSRANQDRPREVYQFLKDIGAKVLQFIPLVERTPAPADRRIGLDLASPPALQRRAGSNASSARRDRSGTFRHEWSVEPVAYGRFLRDIFDVWVRRDVGRTFVQLFEVMLGIWSGMESPLCVFKKRCGTALAMEHNGDVYSCDHFVYPQHRLGNLMNDELASLLTSSQQQQFATTRRTPCPATAVLAKFSSPAMANARKSDSC
jgi:uncharacterized protein